MQEVLAHLASGIPLRLMYSAPYPTTSAPLSSSSTTHDVEDDDDVAGLEDQDMCIF